MPYKDPEKQRQAQHASYLRNRERIYQRQLERRAQGGYRESEYASRLGLSVEEYRKPRPRPARPPRPTLASRLVDEAMRETTESRALRDQQRAMKEAALRRRTEVRA